MKTLSQNTALLVIDMQVGFDDPAWGARNNPMAEANVATLIAAWRTAGAPVVHVHHDSPGPGGRMRPGTPGNAPKPQAQPLPDEPVYRKRVNSAFIGTKLEGDLRDAGVEALFIVGLTTNHCISTTARMAGNLGFETFVLADATAAFDSADLNGDLRAAQQVHTAALSDLQGEFAEVVETAAVLAALFPAATPIAVQAALSPSATAVPGPRRAGGRIATLIALAAAGAVFATPRAAWAGTGAGAAVRPGDDFNAYANAEWVKETPLPPGLATYGPSSMLRAESAKRVRALIEAAATLKSATGAARKIGDYYASWMDTDSIEAKGLAPVAADLAAIAALRDRKALSSYLGATLRPDDGTNTETEGLFGVWAHQGFHDPDHYIPHLVQSGLSLDREDYLDNTPAKADRRKAYRSHVAAVLTLAGIDQGDARAERVLALEAAIARTHASAADTADVFKTDNLWRRADFQAKAPGLDWDAYFKAARLERQSQLQVWQPSAVIGAASLVASQPLEAWRDYLAFHRLQHDTPVLPNAFRQEAAAFAGAPGPDRAQQARAAADTALGEAIGKLYVDRYFPPEAKAAAVAMAETIRAAFRVRIEAAAWMAPETKAKALTKLAAVKVGLGYPDSWTDYAGLRVVRGEAFANLRRAEAFAYRREIDRLSQPVDPAEWGGILPHTVNALIVLSPNALQFSAGLLQPPYFDAAGDAAANYGSAGAGMAHEISHSFDELGAIYDDQGRLGNWWTADDLARYRAAGVALAKQYDAYCPEAGLCLHGAQIVDENSADLIGLAVAHDAYRLSLQGRVDVVKNGLTGEQRFFLAFAQRWRTVRTPAALSRQVMTDTHAPWEYRADTVRNLDAWYQAFDIQPGDRLYLRPDERVRIW